jgi:hypothetical protein
MSCSARDVDDARRRAVAQGREDGLGHPPRPQEVGLERLADLVEVGVDAALPGVVEDRGVVDEHVEAVEACSRGAHALGIGDVELDRRDVAAHLARRPRALGRVAGPEEDAVAALRELAAHLEADAAIGAGDECDGGGVSRRGGRPCRRRGGRGAR